MPLARIYVLDEGSGPKLGRLPPRGAFWALVVHSYLNRALIARAHVSSRFDACARLATAVPFCRVSRRLSFAELPSLVSFLEEDMARCA